MNDTRAFPIRPIVGVGAAIVDGEHVLIVRRGRPPLQGRWSLPGGAVEVGETLASALQREVLEETGLIVEVGPIVDVLDRIHMNDDGRVEYHYVLIDYLCFVLSGHLHAQSDAADARWVSRAQLPAYEVSETAIAVIDKAFALAANASRA